MGRPREVTRSVNYSIVRASVYNTKTDKVSEHIYKIARIYKNLAALNRYMHKKIDTDEQKFLFVKEVNVKKELLAVPLEEYLAIAKPCTSRK